MPPTITTTTVPRRYRRRYYSETQVRFSEAPPPPYLEALKAYGFRWHRRGQYWYAPSTVARATVCGCLSRHCTDLDTIAMHVGECEAEARCGII